MAGEPDWVPPGVDTRRANVARVYDYWLGGSHNFLADQDLGRAISAVDPSVRVFARANRAFLGRAVRFLAAEGIRQFLDIGSGIPTEGNVHEIAQDADPAARVAYVDIDPVAVAHSRAILAGQQMVLPFIADADDPWRIVATLRDALAPGSYLVLCHGTDESRPTMVRAAEAVYNRSVATEVRMRSRADVLRFFDGFDLVDPGLVYVSQWRPGSPAEVPDDPGRLWGLVGIGRKPG